MKNSHIQMPKTVLKEFENKEKRCLYYYSFADQKIHRGHAKTLNTELGYYSDSTEDFLSKKIETKLGMLISQLKLMSFENGEIAPKEYEEVAFSYIYSLISRSSSFFESMKASSTFFQLFDVTSQHDVAAQNGYVTACELGLLKNYKVGFVLNEAEESMVIPTGGVVQLGMSLYCPLTPRRGICFISSANKKFYADNQIPVMSIGDEMINKINVMSFKQERERDKGYIASDRYETLSGLVTNCLISLQ